MTQAQRQTTTPVLGSILLASRNPERLRAWYRRALGPVDDQDGYLTFGTTTLVICDRDDIAATNGEPGRLLLNFYVDDAAAVEARLIAMDTVWIRELDRTCWGVIGTVVDPDGNYVQIIEPAPQNPQ